MKRAAQPVLSQSGEQARTHYEQRMRVEEDLSMVTGRNYISDIRQFAARCELTWRNGREDSASFMPEAVSTPTLIDYRTHLQETLQLKPNSVNRALVSLKHYFAWLVITKQLKYDLAKVVRLLEEEVTPPRHLNDQEEQALVAAVTNTGTARDCAIIVLILRTREDCTLTCAHIQLGKGSETIVVHGKRNKYRETPLNATARTALQTYNPSLSKTEPYDTTPLFLFEKRHAPLTDRGLGYLIKKYAELCSLRDASPNHLRHRFAYRMATSVTLHRLARNVLMETSRRICSPQECFFVGTYGYRITQSA